MAKTGSGRGKTQPFYFKLKDGQPFAFAGLWEIWQPARGSGTAQDLHDHHHQANAVVAPVHERMPVILVNAHAWDWVTGGPGVVCMHLLVPFNPGMDGNLPRWGRTSATRG